MNRKVIYSTVIYKCHDFDIFIDDYLKSVFCQTDNDFELMLLLDDADETKVKKKVDELNVVNMVVHIYTSNKTSTPIQLRKKLIDISYQLEAEVLIFSDFDETVACNRVEEVIKNIDDYSFVFNDFYLVNSKLQRLDDISFFNKRILPDVITDWNDIKSYNYIGFGSLAINLVAYDYSNVEFPGDIQALDWYLASKILLDGGCGLKLKSTYANYRQHENSFVGFDFNLNAERLEQGLNVKESHYGYFKEYNNCYADLYAELIELKQYISIIGKENYITTINSRFDTSKFCWWENIKLKKEINDDI